MYLVFIGLQVVGVVMQKQEEPQEQEAQVEVAMARLEELGLLVADQQTAVVAVVVRQAVLAVLEDLEQLLFHIKILLSLPVAEQ
jgi:ABC-type microcin C transport system duplicated ATPase subunit YejF